MSRGRRWIHEKKRIKKRIQNNHLRSRVGRGAISKSINGVGGSVGGILQETKCRAETGNEERRGERNRAEQNQGTAQLIATIHAIPI